jgi:NAD-dependent dihydropyrimidine dehydrogenase PreA subunit
MNKPNISDIHNCYGCGVCTKACPVHIIDLHLNKEGFYEPFIAEEDKCIHCGLCRDVCAYIKDEPAQNNAPVASYAAWSNDEQVQKKCSSGGAGFEIGKYLLSKGYKVVGVRYNAEKGRAEHFVASSLEELVQTTGSKYIQSYPVDGWKDIDRKGKYLVTGTPCQIDSFRYYMKKMRLPEENFILLDFFCHGVPSMLTWQKYTKDVEKRLGGKITYASWRNKWDYGWHDSWIIGIDVDKHGEKVDWHESYNLLIRGKKTFLQSRFSQGDKFFRLFLGDQCLGRQCYEHCKYYYDHSSADIRICDLWGKTYQDNEDGVSGAVAFTEKGAEILKEIDCHLIEHPFSVVAEGQMKTCPKMLPLRDSILTSLADENKTIDDAVSVLDTYHRRQRNIGRLKHPVRTVYHLVKRIFK